MKILLLGDYSSLQKYLKDGLTELGYDTTLVSQGDSFKKIENDYRIGSRKKNLSGFIEGVIRSLVYLPKMVNYDVVQLINPRIFPAKFGYDKLLLSIIFKSAQKKFLYACGDDANYWRAKNAFRYSPHKGHLEDLKGKNNWWETEQAKELNDWVSSKVEGISATGYIYFKSNCGVHDNLKYIPLPVNCREIDYKPNLIENKIVFFHGLNREGFKGTKYVREAFEIIKKRYPNTVEVLIKGKMSLEEYKKVLAKSTVVIDQVLTYGIGMNALISMAMGKVVLGGAEPEALTLMGIEKNPVINITPSVDDIVEKMEMIIKNKNKIPSWGQKSRNYVEEHHSHVDVAKEMLRFWDSV